MKKFLLISSMFMLTFCCVGQTGDMIVIKKKGQSVKTFMKGLYASFKTVHGQWINAYVHDLRNDSLFYKEVIVRQVPTQWGVSRMDTMATLYHGLHYTDIVAIPKRRESFAFIRNGSLFMLGGAGFVGLNVVNSAILKYPVFGEDNLPALLTGAGVFGFGLLLQKLHKDVITVGKQKYTIHYLKLK